MNMNMNMHRKLSRLLPTVLALAFTVVTPSTWADNEASPERAIKTRQATYFLMGQQLAKINATVKGDLPFDKASLELSADVLVMLSKLAPQSYPVGSDQGATKAKADIWKDMVKFNKLAQDSQVEAGKLKAAVVTGDMALIKAAYGATSHSCKSCHDAYKDK
jgi:cytochrome c556